MTEIPTPKTPDNYPDRSLDCQQALDDGFVELRLAAEKAGWTEEDVATALLELARNNIEGMEANRKMQEAIKVARWTGRLGP